MIFESILKINNYKVVLFFNYLIIKIRFEVKFEDMLYVIK